MADDLLTQVFSDPTQFHIHLEGRISLQASLDKAPIYRSFSWQVLRQAMEVFGAKTYIGETGLTAPPFFLIARWGANVTWGVIDDSPIAADW